MDFEYDEAHRIIEEALGSIRLYARLGSSPLAAQQARNVAYILKKTGKRRNSRILTEAADAISRTYAGEDASDEPPAARPAPVTGIGNGTRAAPFNPAAVITAVAPNPKRPGCKAFSVYALYRVGMTVEEFFTVAANAYSGPASHLRYDYSHGYISLAAPGTPVDR